MSLNLFQIIFFSIFFLCIFFIWYRYKIIYITNYFLGFVIVHLCCDFYLKNGIFSKGNPSAKEEILLYLAEYIFFNILFLTSFLLFLFKKENWKKNYFIIPIIVFILILFVAIYIENSFNSLVFFGISLFISFFPLYFYSYYLKFLKK